MSDELERFSDDVLWKARYAVHHGRVQPDSRHDDVFWVERSSGGKQYRVKLSETYQTCTCPNGMNLGSTPLCYHVAAAEMLREKQEEQEETDYDEA